MLGLVLMTAGLLWVVLCRTPWVVLYVNPWLAWFVGGMLVLGLVLMAVGLRVCRHQAES